eukprot:7671772-Pyramimonas_sp.AAC.1
MFERHGLPEVRNGRLVGCLSLWAHTERGSAPPERETSPLALEFALVQAAQGAAVRGGGEAGLFPPGGGRE